MRGLVGGRGHLFFYRHDELGHVYAINESAMLRKSSYQELHTVEDYLSGDIYAAYGHRTDRHSPVNYAPDHGASSHSCA